MKLSTETLCHSKRNYQKPSLNFFFFNSSGLGQILGSEGHAKPTFLGLIRNRAIDNFVGEKKDFEDYFFLKSESEGLVMLVSVFITAICQHQLQAFIQF